MSAEISVFKSAEKEKEFVAAYDEAMKLWPVPYETIYISTRFGETYVIVSGSEEGEPILLFPGFSFCSPSWYANVETLGAKHRIYAVDVIDDLGRSKASVVPETREELADWLREVCEGLNIEKPHLVGLSSGAFLAINFAYHYPDLVGKVILLAPAAIFGKLSLMFWIQVFSLSILPIKSRRAGFLKWMVVDPKVWDNAHGDLIRLTMRVVAAPIKKVYPSVFTDEELKRIKNSTLLIVGEHEVMYKNAPRAIERAKQLMPNLQVELLPYCGHAVPLESAEFVNSRILDFLVEG
ncbi:alpha/beta fold hydrolase [Chloroflexota bacterium]